MLDARRGQLIRVMNGMIGTALVSESYTMVYLRSRGTCQERISQTYVHEMRLTLLQLRESEQFSVGSLSPMRP